MSENAVPSATRWWVLATVATAQLMVVLDSSVVNIALPSAQKDLGFTNAERQWVVTAYSLAFGSLLLLGGRLSDIVGRKVTFIVGLIGFAGSSALGGAATSFGMLVAARTLQGAFGAVLAPTALAVLTTTFTIPRERARAFGVFGAIAGGGGAVGLLLGGILTQDLSWRWSLYVNVVFAIVAVIGALIFVHSPRRGEARPQLDIPGAVLICAGLFALVLGFSNAETDGWHAIQTWGLLVACVILLAAFTLWQRRASHPLLPLIVVLNRNRGAAFLAVLIAGAGTFALFLFLTYYLQGTLGYSPIQTGVAFLPMIGMLTLSAQFATNVFNPRFGPKILVPLGMFVVAVGMVLLTRLDAHSTYAADVLPSLLVMGAGMGAIMPPAVQTATLGVDRHFAGVASALVNTNQQVGGSIGTSLLNTIAASAATAYVTAHVSAHTPPTATTAVDATIHSYTTVYWVTASIFVLGGIVTAFLFRRRQATAQAAAPEQAEGAPVAA